MPKKEAEKKPAVSVVAPPSVAEDERAIEVSLVNVSDVDALQEVVVLLRLNNEPRLIYLRDAVKAAPNTTEASGQAQRAPPLPLLPLSRQLVRVGTLAALDALLNQREANRIDVYALPTVAAETEGGGGGGGGGGGRGGRGADKKPKAPAAAGGGKGKGQANSGAAAGPPEGARCIGGANLSLVPLLSGASLDVAVAVAGLGAFTAELCVRVSCQEAPLLSEADALRCRPVVLRVGGLAGLPTRDGAPMSLSAGSPRVLRARVELAAQRVETPPLTVAAGSTASGLACPSALAGAAVGGREAPVAFHEHVFFLSTMGAPLQVYRLLHAQAVTVSLWQSFYTEAPHGSLSTPLDSLLGGKTTKDNRSTGSTETLLGSGAFSVRDFLSDDQLRFSEAVQLLPDRSSVSLAGGQSCLTASSSLNVSLRFLHPFPRLQHVDATGALLTRKAFLTRAVLRVPFQTPWMADLLALLLREVTALPRATADVHAYVPPPPSPPPESAETLEKAAAATAATSARNSKKGGSATPGGGKGAAARIAPAAEPEAEAAMAPGFDAPLQVVSPPGLSGFEVTDGKDRVWCVEGTVPEVHHVLTRVTAFLQARRYPDTEAALLFNAELFVPARAYLSFPALVTPPAGAAAAASPSASVSATAPPPPSSPSAAAVGDVALEVEPSGTGGRLHRLRLRATLDTLRQTQGHYVRHNLSDDCLGCVTALSALLRVASMREAETRRCLPSAALLIALERSFGQTLEREDLFGATPPSSPTSGTAASAVAAAVASVPPVVSPDTAAPTPPFTASATLLGAAAVGSLVSFDGTLKSGGPRRAVPAAVHQRFPVVAWMVVAGTAEDILCAFALSAPTGLVQYHVEGQVVQAGAMTLLYVLTCACLARSVTHSHNVEYEQTLRQRQRAQQAHLVRKAVLWPQSTTAAKAPVPPPTAGSRHDNTQGGGSGGGRKGKTRVSTSVTSTTARHVPTAASPASGDVPSDGDDDWLESDFYDRLDAAPAPGRGSGGPHGTFASSQREPQEKGHRAQERPRGRDAGAAQKGLSSEELWRMYDERAPVASAASATAAATVNGGKLPPLRL